MTFSDNIQVGRRAMREYEREQEKRKIQKKNKNWLRENFDTKYMIRKTSSDFDESVPPTETAHQKRWRERKERFKKAPRLGQTDC